MKRISLSAAIAALTCSILVACGGGGGSDSTGSTVASAPPVSSTPASSPAVTPTPPSPPASAVTPPVTPPSPPNCVPVIPVHVAIMGDSTNYAIDGSVDLTSINWWDPRAKAVHSPEVEVQAAMDAQFGYGMVEVKNYSVPGSTSAMWAAQANNAEVKEVNWGINDKNGNMPIADFLANIKAAGATIVATQYPSVYDDPRTQAYIDAIKGMGLPVVDSNAYITSLPNWQSNYPNPLSAHVTDDLTKSISDNVIAPVVAEQVKKLLCLNHGNSTSPKATKIQLFGDSTQWLAGPYWAQRYTGMVDNQAVPGTTSGQLLSGTDNAHAAWPAPVSGDVVVIKFGANDTLPWFNTSVEQFKQNLRDLLKGVKGRAVLETPDPTLDPNRPNEGDYTQAVRDVAHETGTLLIDTDACWKARGQWADMIGSDLEHANELGRAYTVDTCVAPIIDRILEAA